MPYTALLNRLIVDSGLTVKEIADRCKANGQEITPSYISLLRNTDNKRIPSDEMSRALAIACNAKHESILLIEAYLDKAPVEIKLALEVLKNTIIAASLCVIDNEISEQDMKAYQNALAQQPLAEIIIAAAEQPQIDFEKGTGGSINLQGSLKDDEVNATVQFNSAIGLPIQDDSMFPILPKGCKTILEVKDLAEYQNGDILCFVEKGQQELMYRKCAFLDDSRLKVAMFPINAQYSSCVFSVDEIIILGKVKQSIIDF